MDKNELIELFAELDKELETAVDIILIGGAAMILHYGALRTTRDVDVLFLRGDISEIRAAIKAVAENRHLSDDWINDAAKGFSNIFLSDFYHRLIPQNFDFQNIRLYVIGKPEQIALKIVALREQDLEDLEILLSEITEQDKKILIDIMEHVNTFRTDWAQKMKYFLEEQGWTIE